MVPKTVSTEDEKRSLLLRLRSALLTQETAIQRIASRSGAILTVQSISPLVNLFKQLEIALPGQAGSFAYHADPNSALPQIAHAIWVVEQSLGVPGSHLHSRHDIYSFGTTNPEAGRIFIGHGHSPLWRELKDFVADTLGLPWDEFNRDAAAGYFTHERVNQMLDHASFAFLLFTGEDELADGSFRTRENVVYEAGLFQGRLGFRRAVVLREDGCSVLSNLEGLTRLDFPKGNIRAVFEDVRNVLAREGFGHAPTP